MRNPHTLIAALMLLLASALIAPVASADDLRDFKARGIIGERADGYLGLVTTDAPQEAKSTVQRINTERREEYQRIAAKHNLDLPAVEILAGKKTLDKTNPGEWIFTDSWRRK